jgi:hypothetical protein
MGFRIAELSREVSTDILFLGQVLLIPEYLP